jgi:hypothetical protein
MFHLTFPISFFALIGAVGFTFCALYYWADEVGTSDDEWLAPRNWPRRVLSAALAVSFWSIWFFMVA